MGSRIRWILVASLGGLLLLAAASGVAAFVVFDHFRAREIVLRARVADRAAFLERVRTGVSFSGTVARDYFVEPAGSTALLDELDRLESQTKEAAGHYMQTSGDADAIQLNGEVLAYWKVVDLMVDMARKPTHATRGVDAYFRRQLTERRETMLSIANRIQAALLRESQSADLELDQTYSRFRWILAFQLASVLAFGTVLAGIAIRRIVRLEADTRALAAQVVRAQEDERRAIARELHDEVGQSLSSLLLDLGRAAAAPNPPDMPAQLAAISATAERTVESVRRIALSLRPSMLDDLGLIPALEWQVREVGNRTGLHIELNAEEAAGDLSDAQKTCVYRVVQETLHNCSRHASASRVRVVLRKVAKTVHLEVDDDGRGFAAARTRGLGLLGMQERVAQLGGRFRVSSEPGRGTTVSAELPL